MYLEPRYAIAASIVALVGVRVGAGANFQRFVVDLLPGAVFLLPRYELVEDARRARARARGLEVARADEAVLVPMHEDRPPTGVVEPDAVRHLRCGADVYVHLNNLAGGPVRVDIFGVLHRNTHFIADGEAPLLRRI